jgi:hypothetical protein
LLVVEIGDRFHANVARGRWAGDDARGESAATLRSGDAWNLRHARGHFFIKWLGAHNGMGNCRAAAVGVKLAQHDSLRRQYAAHGIDTDGNGQCHYKRSYTVVPQIMDYFIPPRR